MAEYMYQIIMNTPLGERRGTMAVHTAGDRMEGSMELFGHSEPFSGVIDAEGNCCMKGYFQTLMNRVPFMAQGIVRAEQLHLLIHRKQDVLEIFGVGCPDGKE